MAVDHMLFNATKYYPLNQNSDSITVGNRTFKEYKFQKYSTKLNNLGTSPFTLIDDYHKLDMNKFTVVTFDNGDVCKALNYELYDHLQDPAAFYIITSQGHHCYVTLDGNSITVAYGTHLSSDVTAPVKPIDVKWCQIEINVD